MSKAIVQQAAGALNAEHYQTFEMAKANDGILGSDDIAQIRSYAAFARAQAQAIHKSIATMGELDDVAQAKAEMTETSQTFAKVSVYADQRIGEILRELPTKQGLRTDTTSVRMDTEVTKSEAIKNAGIAHPQAVDLQKMAANPEVVEAVIAKAEQDGRVVSRSQVLKEIDERKRAERELRKASIAQTNLEMEAESLRQQLAAKPEPEVIEREVIPEETRKIIRELEKSNKQFSEDYEDLRRRFSSTQTELEQARKELATNEAALASIREVQALTRAMGEFVGRYSGHTWPFADIDEQTMGEFAQALNGLTSFVNALGNDVSAYSVKQTQQEG